MDGTGDDGLAGKASKGGKGARVEVRWMLGREENEKNRRERMERIRGIGRDRKSVPILLIQWVGDNLSPTHTLEQCK